jgi:hypothetical protein
MHTNVRIFFERYERAFMKALSGELDMDDICSFYAAEFIAVSPAGVIGGKNDDQLKQVMTQGYARYREIGTREMRIRDVNISPLDELHCVAHVAWTAIYARNHQPDVAIDFEVHYLVQQLKQEPRIFGWVSGDEQELLRKNGVVAKEMS